MLVWKRFTGIIFLSFGFAAAAMGPNDPVVLGQTFVAGSMDPTQGSSGWALTSHGVAKKLFTVNQDGNIVGQVGRSVAKLSEFVWEVTLKSDYKFSDGTPVTAENVAICLAEPNEKNPNAQSSLGAMTVAATGELTLTIQSERATHIMESVLAEWAFVVYLKDEQGNFLFTGPYAIESFASEQIELVPNEEYPRAEERPDLKIQKFDNGHDLADSLRNEMLDVGFHLPIDTLPSFATRRMFVSSLLRLAITT